MVRTRDFLGRAVHGGFEQYVRFYHGTSQHMILLLSTRQIWIQSLCIIFHHNIPLYRTPNSERPTPPKIPKVTLKRRSSSTYRSPPAKETSSDSITFQNPTHQDNLREVGLCHLSYAMINCPSDAIREIFRRRVLVGGSVC